MLLPCGLLRRGCSSFPYFGRMQVYYIYVVYCLSVCVLCASPVGALPSDGHLRGPPLYVGPLRGPSGAGSPCGVLPSGV